MKRLDGQVAIVTGAAQGPGRAFARALEREGASVVCCDVDPSVCEAEGEGGRAGHQIGLWVDRPRKLADSHEAALRPFPPDVTADGDVR